MFIELNYIANPFPTNMKECFKHRDLHFQCLDDNNTVANHKLCDKTYPAWNDSCAGYERKHQMVERYLLKSTHRLYTQEELDKINKYGKV